MINRVLLFLVILAACLVCTACSGSVDFVVVNESDETIDLEYVLDKKNIYTPPGQTGHLPPSLTPDWVDLHTWDRTVRREDWQEMSPDQVAFDESTMIVRIRVPPRMAIRVIQANDSILFGDGYKHFPITRLDTRGRSGGMRFEGSQLFRQFAQKEFSHRFIAYKRLGDSGNSTR